MVARFGEQAGEILAREPLRAGHAPQRQEIVAQQAAFLGDAAAQLVLVNDDAGVGRREHRKVAGVVGVKVRDDDVGEVRRLHVDLRETLRKQPVRPGIVDHRFLVEIVLPVLVECLAHPGIDEYLRVVVVDDVGINRMRDLAVRPPAGGCTASRCRTTDGSGWPVSTSSRSSVVWPQVRTMSFLAVIGIVPVTSPP